MNRFGPDAVGARLGVTEKAVRHYANMARTPRAPMCALIESTYGIPAQAWRVLNRAPAPPAYDDEPEPALSEDDDDATDADEKAPLSTKEECEALLASVKRQLRLAEKDPATPPAIRSQLASTMVRVLAQLARHRGEGELSEAMIARSAPFRRLRDVIVLALRPYPDALRAVRADLARIEGVT